MTHPNANDVMMMWRPLHILLGHVQSLNKSGIISSQNEIDAMNAKPMLEWIDDIINDAPQLLVVLHLYFQLCGMYIRKEENRILIEKKCLPTELISKHIRDCARKD